MKRVACLSRVSTDDQHTSIENQEEIFKAWINKNNDCVLYKTYIDEGISGTKGYKRKAWLEMLEDGKNKEFDILLAKSYSRFGRNMTETLQAIKDLRTNNVRVIFLEDNLDSGKDMSHFGLFSWLAEQEAHKTSERIKTVWDSYNEQGKIHTAHPPYGYDYDKESKNFVVNEDEKKIVKEVYKMYITGNGFAKISKELEERGVASKRGGRWGTTTIKNMLTNEVYLGTLVQGKTRTLDVTMKENEKIDKEKWYKHLNNHEAIVGKDIFLKVQEELKERSNRAKKSYIKEHNSIKTSRHSNKNLFSNILVCGDCGSTMTIKRKKGIKNYKPFYQCNVYSLHSLKSGHSSNFIWEDFLVEYIKNKLDGIVKNKYKEFKEKLKQKDRANDSKVLENEQLKIRKNIEKQTNLANKLLELLVKGTIMQEQFTLQNEGIAKQIGMLNNRKAEIEQKLKKQNVTKTEEDELKQGINTLLETDTENWNNAMLRCVIDKIVVCTNNTISIYYKYINS